MKAVTITDARRVELVDRAIPEPAGRRVVVRVEAAPLCGSDLRLLYRLPGRKPFVPGHEGAGTVVAVRGALTVKEGYRVCVINPRISCGTCEMCRRGYPLYCDNDEGMHGFTVDGWQAEYALVDERTLRRVPDWMHLEEASLLLDPVGTPLHALERAGARAPCTIGIFGLGPMGLGAVSVAVFLGCRVLAADPNPVRRALAKSLGAAEIFDGRGGDAAAAMRAAAGRGGLDVALECSGNPAAFLTALELLRPLGRLSLIGECEEATFSPSAHVLRKELTIFGSTCFPEPVFGRAIALCERGLDPRRIVTHRLPLENAAEAYDMFDNGLTGKVVLTGAAAATGAVACGR